MKLKFIITCLLYSLVFTVVANCYRAVYVNPGLLFIFIPIFLAINAVAGFLTVKSKSKTLKTCYHGTVLLTVFAFSVILSVVYHIVLAFKTIPDNYMTFIWSAVLCTAVHAVLFWNGIICVYLTSVQLGIKHRIIGAICGLIPIANLIALFSIITITYNEVALETKKERLNNERRSQKICATKYPILLVHGVFFRDAKYFNYWGRIPKELEQNGAKIYYGNQQSAASIADNAAELKLRIEEILKETGAEKVNIIAHSKGGLDCRYAISKLGAAPLVASLTTINTPHRGCLFADSLLKMFPDNFKQKVATGYNNSLKVLGDKSPDFLAAVNDLTDEFCQKLDTEMGTPDGVYCQSVGSVLKKATSGKFPLNLSFHLVKMFDGANDGLVSEKSFRWGEKYTLLTPKGKRGISHGDMIDLNRENIKGFDVREFYVQLLSQLKEKGF